MTDLRRPPVNDGDLFSERARQYAQDKPLQRLHILEAGCGWGRGLDLGDRERQVTGVDLDAPALRAHTSRRTDLDAWHLGDLRTVPMPPRAYDIVHATYLIERVPNAELVLDRFVAALKPGGLLLIRIRDRNTAFGFLDRTLPRWLSGPIWSRLPARERLAHAEQAHAEQAQNEEKAEKKAQEKAENKDEEARGHADVPPRGVYERVASRQGMQWYCVMRGLVIAEEYTSRDSLNALAAGTGLAGRLCRLVATLSRGRLTAEYSETTLVIRKPENRFARVI
ncbi:class I SAM-dependent methyltransferase [Actinomadura rudentiformis]|uniref:class I SAM-dependent methyltransferase n=1 Tax=Actinomadura rudentiformis TaxID=359158 RepID=UPI001CEF8E81|nr:class I SAM-dependent methyltransferase [Actinomadura rudentiformis]